MKQTVHKLILLVVIFIISMGDCFAQSKTSDDRTVQVFFRQSATTIDPAYRDNDTSLRRFVDVVNEHCSSTQCSIVELRITASVSPEGLNSVNERIVKARAESIIDWIKQHTTHPVEYTIDFEGIDWTTFITLVEERPISRYLPYRDEVLELLRNTPDSIAGKPLPYNYRYAKLSKLHNGEPSIWLKKYIFPDLRYATAELVISIDVATDDVATIEKECVEESVADDAAKGENEADGVNAYVEESATADAIGKQESSDSSLADESLGTTSPTPGEEISTNDDDSKSRSFCMALKTNMLYLLAAVPNLGAEVHMGGGWSLAANWQYAWWSSDAACWYHRIYGGDASLRKWFGKRATKQHFAGHHVGIYGQMLTYDFVFGKESTGQLADKWSYGAGIEYGYSLPIGKALRFDFTLGVGYLTGTYKTYKLQDDCYVWQQTRKRNYFGPTKAEISLVWVIGGKKGGRL